MTEAARKQRSAEWYAARRGSLGASDIADVLARTKTGWSTSRANVMNRLLIERLTGRTVHGHATWAMREGIEREPEARLAYMFHADVDVADAWVYPHPKIRGAHASPDGLVGDDGLVQIKCPQPPAHLDLLLGGETPPGYIMQMQWEMVCTGRTWSDFVSWQPDFPASMQLIVRRVERDEEHIAELEAQVRAFLEETDARFQALLTAYEPERTFAKAAANARSGRAQSRQPHQPPASSMVERTAGAA
jgi:putative phage-type endonuclease